MGRTTPTFVASNGMTITPGAYNPATGDNQFNWMKISYLDLSLAIYSFAFVLTTGGGPDASYITMSFPFTVAIDWDAYQPDSVMLNGPFYAGITASRMEPGERDRLRIFGNPSAGVNVPASATVRIAGKGFAKL